MGGRTWPSPDPQKSHVSPTLHGKSQQSRPQVRNECPIPRGMQVYECQIQARAAVCPLASPATSVSRLPL